MSRSQSFSLGTRLGTCRARSRLWYIWCGRCRVRVLVGPRVPSLRHGRPGQVSGRAGRRGRGVRYCLRRGRFAWGALLIIACRPYSAQVTVVVLGHRGVGKTTFISRCLVGAIALCLPPPPPPRPVGSLCASACACRAAAGPARGVSEAGPVRHGAHMRQGHQDHHCKRPASRSPL